MCKKNTSIIVLASFLLRRLFFASRRRSAFKFSSLLLFGFLGIPLVTLGLCRPRAIKILCLSMSSHATDRPDHTGQGAFDFCPSQDCSSSWTDYLRPGDVRGDQVPTSILSRNWAVARAGSESHACPRAGCEYVSPGSPASEYTRLHAPACPPRLRLRPLDVCVAGSPSDLPASGNDILRGELAPRRSATGLVRAIRPDPDGPGVVVLLANASVALGKRPLLREHYLGLPDAIDMGYAQPIQDYISFVAKRFYSVTGIFRSTLPGQPDCCFGCASPGCGKSPALSGFFLYVIHLFVLCFRYVRTCCLWRPRRRARPLSRRLL